MKDGEPCTSRGVSTVVLSRILDNTTYPELLIIPKSFDSSWEIK